MIFLWGFMSTNRLESDFSIEDVFHAQRAGWFWSVQAVVTPNDDSKILEADVAELSEGNFDTIPAAVLSDLGCCGIFLFCDEDRWIPVYVESEIW